MVSCHQSPRSPSLSAPRRLSIFDRPRCHVLAYPLRSLFLFEDPLYLARRKSVAILSPSCATRCPIVGGAQWSWRSRGPSSRNLRVGVRSHRFIPFFLVLCHRGRRRGFMDATCVYFIWDGCERTSLDVESCRSLDEEDPGMMENGEKWNGMLLEVGGELQEFLWSSMLLQ